MYWPGIILYTINNQLIKVASHQWHRIFRKEDKQTRKLLLILVIGWLLGFFVFNLGSLIHILLVIAIIAILFRLIRGGSI